MPRTKTIQASQMGADGSDGAEIRVRLASPDDMRGMQGDTSRATTIEVADPDNVTADERIFFQCRIPRRNDQDGNEGTEVDEWVQLNATNFPSLTAQHRTALAGVLRSIYKDRRDALGLAPAGE